MQLRGNTEAHPPRFDPLGMEGENVIMGVDLGIGSGMVAAQVDPGDAPLKVSVSRRHYRDLASNDRIAKGAQSTKQCTWTRRGVFDHFFR